MKTGILAAIDIGSNTVHLTVMRVGPGRRLKHILARTRILRLGRIVQSAHRLTPSAVSLVRAALRDFVRLAKKKKASPILIGATAAMRGAPRGREILKKLSRQIGVPIHLLAKGQEGVLGFDAVRSDLDPRKRTLFVDSGGGSTELTLARGRTPVKCISLPIGSAKLSVALRHDPPGPLDLSQLMEPILESLRRAPREFKPRKAIFTGGTAHHLGILADAEPGRLTRADIDLALRRLIRRRAKKLAAKFDIPIERIALLAPGALILGAILDHYQLKEAAVTHQGLRDGMVLAYLRKGETWSK